MKYFILFVLIVSSILTVLAFFYADPLYIVWHSINTIWLAGLYAINR